MGNKNLASAKAAKKDEFYTEYADIEKECRNYGDSFRDKVVFCNCDDPFESNFFKYFVTNFHALGLKELIATSYGSSPVVYTQPSLFGEEEVLCREEAEQKAHRIEIREVPEGSPTDINTLLMNPNNSMTDLTEDGDFRSPECVELLQQADIVVTNPPFSLFREYIGQLIEYEKQFLIIGNLNALHYKEVFPLIQENKMWLGESIHSGDREFRVPEDYPLNAATCRIGDDGHKYIRVKGVRWFTTLDYKARHEDLELTCSYDPNKYPKYVNYDAINVDKTSEIPYDYDGAMGVPDSFLDKYNPSQFEIIGLGSGYLGQSIGVGGILPEHKQMMRGHSAAGDLYYLTADGKPKVPYSRILIKRK